MLCTRIHGTLGAQILSGKVEIIMGILMMVKIKEKAKMRGERKGNEPLGVGGAFFGAPNIVGLVISG